MDQKRNLVRSYRDWAASAWSWRHVRRRLRFLLLVEDVLISDADGARKVGRDEAGMIASSLEAAAWASSCNDLGARTSQPKPWYRLGGSLLR